VYIIKCKKYRLVIQLARAKREGKKMRTGGYILDKLADRIWYIGEAKLNEEEQQKQ